MLQWGPREGQLYTGPFGWSAIVFLFTCVCGWEVLDKLWCHRSQRGCAGIRCKIECLNRKSINLFNGARCLFKILPAKVWGANRCCLFKWNLMKPRFPGVTHLLILNYQHLTERHFACAFHNKSDSVAKCSPFKCTTWEPLQQYSKKRIYNNTFWSITSDASVTSKANTSDAVYMDVLCGIHKCVVQ